MKAILLKDHGGPEKLKFGNYPTPIPKSGFVLVKLKVSALNRMDVWVREGWKGLKLNYPHILGADGAGEVVALGKGVNLIKVEDRVVINANLADSICKYCLDGKENQCVNWQLLGESTNGTYAEYVSVPERNLVVIPDHISFSEAAASSLVYLTAWHSLITKGKLKAGEKILIVGASGGVNTASIQIAKLAGAEVIVIGSNEKKLSLADSLGADLLIDRGITENWSKEIYKITNKQGVDVVVDNVGSTYQHSMRSVRKGGRILTVGNTGGPIFQFDNRYMFGKHITLIGTTMGTINDFHKVMSLIFTGKLSPVIDNTFPLCDAAEAHKYLDSGSQMGKVLLDIE